MRLILSRFAALFSPLHKWLWPCVLLILGYVAWRAFVLSLTWDEAYTFFEFIRHPSWLPHDLNYMASNNHLLNTWLEKCSVGLLGQSELAQRLPNVAGCAVFLYAAGAIATKIFSHNFERLAVFLVLALNPYMLDFFSLARGYGISIGLFMFAAWQMALYVEKPGLLRATGIQLLLALATLANLTMILVMIAATAVLWLHQILQNDKKRIRAFILLVVPIIFMICIWPYVMRLNSAGAFYFGQEALSPYTSFFSIIDASLYGRSYAAWLAGPLTVVFILLPLAGLFLLFRNRRNRDSKWHGLLSFALLFMLIATGMILQHILLGSHYLLGRTALVFLPAGMLLLITAVALTGKRIRGVIISAMAIVTLGHFALSANFRSVYEGREQADVKAMMKFLREKNIPVERNFLANIISTGLPFDQQVNYYRMRYGLMQFGHVPRLEEVPACSWYYLDSAALKEFPAAEKLRYFPFSNTVLFRADKNLPRLRVLKEVWQDFENEWPFPQLITDTIFFGKKGTYAGGEIPYSVNIIFNQLDTLPAFPEAASLSCRLRTQTRNTSALLVFQFIKENGVQEEFMHLSELAEKPGQWSITGWTRPVPAGTKRILVYIWNKDRKRVYMDNVILRLLIAE
ncbi:MAG TPA: hypothetical protein VI731_11030 [Bacteroidia bacterium]|nr:hypothetical protein [Bacteroidia bacterium]